MVKLWFTGILETTKRQLSFYKNEDGTTNCTYGQNHKFYFDIIYINLWYLHLSNCQTAAWPVNVKDVLLFAILMRNICSNFPFELLSICE